MAESETSDASSLRNISGSLFGIPGFLVGFGTKGSSEYDSIRSPTSPLDIGVFSNFKNPVKLRFARSWSEKKYRKEWNGYKLGLGVVNSLVDDSAGGVLGRSKQKNIIFAPRVSPKATDYVNHSWVPVDSSLRSKSLPINYVASDLDSQLCGKNISCECDDEDVPSLLCNSDSDKLFSEVKYGESSSLMTGKSPETENSSGVKVSTFPIPIKASQGLVGSLSAREIELSEDYTCIISHGPNPKTIHIFGDCVLESHANCFGGHEKEPPPQEKVVTCDTCKRKLEEDEEAYMFRDEKAFCSFDCCSDDLSEEETEKTCRKSVGRSASFQEDLLLLGMPVTM